MVLLDNLHSVLSTNERVRIDARANEIKATATTNGTKPAKKNGDRNRQREEKDHDSDEGEVGDSGDDDSEESDESDDQPSDSDNECAEAVADEYVTFQVAMRATKAAMEAFARAGTTLAAIPNLLSQVNFTDSKIQVSHSFEMAV